MTNAVSTWSGRSAADHFAVDHLAVARSFARNPQDWPVTPQFDSANRWFSCLSQDADAQVWLLTWMPGQATELHDHGGSAGAFVVVSGALTEQTIRPAHRGSQVGGSRYGGVERTAELITAGHGRRFGGSHIHRIENTGKAPAISIHVYGPALETMTRYRLVGGQLRELAVDRAGVSW